MRPWMEIVFHSFMLRGSLPAWSTQQVKAREYIFRTDFKGEPSCVVAKYDEYFMFSCSYLSFESKLSLIVVISQDNLKANLTQKRQEKNKGFFIFSHCTKILKTKIYVLKATRELKWKIHVKFVWDSQIKLLDQKRRYPVFI